jgi:hypothetical protein
MIGIIIISVLGGLALIVFGIVFVICLKKRKKKEDAKAAADFLVEDEWAVPPGQVRAETSPSEDIMQSFENPMESSGHYAADGWPADYEE